ncbi:hypothetical protein ACSNN7_00915 [Micromonospora sp. URMC 105]
MDVVARGGVVVAAAGRPPNDGYADVTDTDTLTVTVPHDCTAEPAQTHGSWQLARGQSAVVDFKVRIRCSQPSIYR